MNYKIQKAFAIITLIETYYKYSTENSLHMVLEDGNTRKSDIQYCRKFAIEHQDYLAELISTLLLDFTETEINSIIEEPWKIYEKYKNLKQSKDTLDITLKLKRSSKNEL